MSFILSFSITLTMKGCWIFIRDLFPWEMITLFLSFESAYMMDNIYWFTYVKSFLLFWNETHFVVMHDLFDMSLILCTSILLRIFKIEFNLFILQQCYTCKQYVCVCMCLTNPLSPVSADWLDVDGWLAILFTGSEMGNHSCSDFMGAVAMSCPEYSIL